METREEETGVKLSSQEPTDEHSRTPYSRSWSSYKARSSTTDEWELVDERPVDYEAESALSKYAFASTGYSQAFCPHLQEQPRRSNGRRTRGTRFAMLTLAEEATERPIAVTSARRWYQQAIHAPCTARRTIERMKATQAVNAGFANKLKGKLHAAPIQYGFTKAVQGVRHFWMRKTYVSKRQRA